MKQFDINSIVKDFNLDKDEIAKVLFPDAKYPKLAFNRIVKGEASLSVEQLEILASHLGIMPASLLTMNSWRDATEDGFLTFEKGLFKVKLNYNGAFLSVYKDNKLVEQMITGASMSIDKFIELIDDLISKHK